MRKKDQILAEVFDSLIQHDSGRIPSEVGELFKLGLRLHNGCPDADPAFLERLGRRLEQEWVAAERVHAAAREARGLLAFLRLAGVRKALRPLVAAAVAAAVLLGSVALVPGLRTPVKASLSRVITIFRGVEVREQPRMAATAPSTTDVRNYASLEEALLAAGFPLRVPSYLPADVQFRRASSVVSDGRRSVVLQYAGPFETDIVGRRNAGASFGADVIIISESPVGRNAADEPLSIPVGEESAEAIEVAGRTALWVEGRWNTQGRWERNPRYGLLQLQDGDVFIRVSSVLGREETVRVVESMFP